MGYSLDYHWISATWVTFAQGAPSPIESPWVKVVLAVVALAFLALKIVEFVLRRRESGTQLPDAFQAKVLEDVRVIRKIVECENPMTGQKLVYIPRDLDTRLEMLREIRAQNGEILRLLDDLVSRWPTSPGV